MRRIAILLAVMVGWTGAVQAAHHEDDAAAVRAVAQAWLAAYNAADLDRLMTLYDAEAFIAINKRPVLKGRQAVRGYLAGQFAALDLKIDMVEEWLTVTGDLAHMSTLFRFAGRPKAGGDGFAAYGRAFLIYRRGADGRWRLYVDVDQETTDAKPELFDLGNQIEAHDGKSDDACNGTDSGRGPDDRRYRRGRAATDRTRQSGDGGDPRHPRGPDRAAAPVSEHPVGPPGRLAPGRRHADFHPLRPGRPAAHGGKPRRGATAGDFL